MCKHLFDLKKIWNDKKKHRLIIYIYLYRCLVIKVNQFVFVKQIKYILLLFKKLKKKNVADIKFYKII